MKSDLTLRALITECKLDKTGKKDEYTFDIMLKIASVLYLTALVWWLTLSGGTPPAHPLIIPIVICLGVILLVVTYLAKNFYYGGLSIWRYKATFLADLEEQIRSDARLSIMLSETYTSESLSICHLQLMSSIKRFDKDTALLSPLNVISGVATVALSVAMRTFHLEPWLFSLPPAFMAGSGIAAILKVSFTRQLTRYEFVIAKAIELTKALPASTSGARESVENLY